MNTLEHQKLRIDVGNLTSWQTRSDTCYVGIFILVLVVSFTLLTTPAAWGQNLLDQDFNHHEDARPYSISDFEPNGGDWESVVPPSWFNGLQANHDGARTSLVTGSEAFRNSGTSLKVDFPADARGPKASGAQWKINLSRVLDEDLNFTDQPFIGPHDVVAIHQMVRLKYRVKFGDGFDFHETTGKLPGLAGGTVPTGFSSLSGNDGWTARLQWIDFDDHANVDGISSGETGHLQQTAKYFGAGNGGRNEDHLSLTDEDGGSLEIESGEWYSITQLVKLNDIGRENGFIKVWVDGTQVLEERRMLFRTVPGLGVDTMYFSTFRGGGQTIPLRPSQDQAIYFDDFKIDVLKTVPLQLGGGGAQSQAIPEPQAAVLVALGMVVFSVTFGRQRRNGVGI